MTIRNMFILGLFLVPLAAAGCSDNPAAVEETAVLLSVIPSGGDTGVDPNTTITLQFSHAMQMDTEMFVALHEGAGVAGPLVDGSFDELSEGRFEVYLESIGATVRLFQSGDLFVRGHNIFFSGL